jgi:hypothetical protein
MPRSVECVAHSLRILRKFLFARNGRFCCGNRAALPSRKPHIDVIFPREIPMFSKEQGSNHNQCLARTTFVPLGKKDDVSTGTLGTEIKPLAARPSTVF